MSASPLPRVHFFKLTEKQTRSDQQHPVRDHFLERYRFEWLTFQSPLSTSQPSWRAQAWGEGLSNSPPSSPSFLREIRRTRFSIFRRGACEGLLFPQLERKLPSRCLATATLWERKRSRPWAESALRRPLPLPLVLRSRSAGKR